MGTSDHIKYSDLVDIPKLQALMESFHQVTGVPNAVVDIDGFVIVKAGWQDACTRAGVWVSIVPDLLTEPTAELAVEFKKQFTKVMSQKGGFQQSTMTGPDVMVLRPAIVNLDITAPYTMQPGVTSFVTSPGSMTL